MNTPRLRVSERIQENSLSSASAHPQERLSLAQVSPTAHNEDYIKMLDRLFKKWDEACNFSWAFLEPFLPNSIEEKTEQDFKNARLLAHLEKTQQEEETLLHPPVAATAQTPLLSNPSSEQKFPNYGSI